MASSVVRVPPDDWAHHHTAGAGGDPCSLVTAARRRQSQILDRWAARQAREMITTIERQSHETELSALSNVRASSLIQMWRELEAEAAPRGGGGGGSVPSAEEAYGGSDADSETERRGVGEMLRMQRLNNSSWAPSSSYEAELLVAAKEQFEKGPTPANFPTVGGGGQVVRVRGRREMEGLMMRLKQERMREIAKLSEEQKVSRFPFRGRIQSLLRLRSLRREVSTIKHQQRSIKLEAEELQCRSNNIFLREIAEDISQHYVNEIATKEHTIGSFVNHFETEDTQHPKLFSTIELEGLPQTFSTPLSRAEDLRQSHSSDASWDKRSSWENSIDWELPEDSSILKGWQGEIVMEETEAFPKEQQVTFTDCNWSSEQSNSCRGWGVIRKTFYHDLFSTFTDNAEICELLERKVVSKFLASDFSDKMNQLIMSFIQRQALHDVNENVRDGCKEQTIWRKNYEDCYDQDPSASSLVPVSSQLLHHQESWLSTSFPQNSSESEQDQDVMNDLRDGFAQIHCELSELRKLVESCLEWQTKLECSIKHEFSSTINQLVGRGKSSLNTKWMPGSNDTCCICCEDQVDTVLYRCGHMCACFKCSQGLQWSSGLCPICHSTIIDVVRVYPNT